MEVVSNAQRIRALGAQCTGEVVFRHIAPDGTGSAFTWRELDRRSDRLAGALSARGLGLGDRLGIGLRNSPQLVFAVFAAWKLGAVPVPVRWDLPEWELARLQEVVAARVHLDASALPWIDGTAERPVPELPDVLSPHGHGICSSGSTGMPKVILNARPALHNPVFSTPLMQMWRPVPRPQTILVLAPMYHANGFSTLFGLLDGDRLVVLEKFDAALAVDAIERHGVTTFTATPTMLQRIADLPGVEGRDLSGLDWILQGAAPMPPSLVRRWAALIGAERIAMAYGMSENIGITALRGDEWAARPGSVGRGLRGTEIRVLDDEGRDLPPGEVGEIYLRSPSYGGSSYLGDAPALPSTPDGFRTAGDVGYLDEDGYLHLLDRRVDIVITGGANVFPAEVEAALIDHPAIADVVVIGLRDERWGRRVHAVVEPADRAAPPTAEEVVAYAKGRLAPYKAPKTVEFVDALPRSTATKINRGAMVAARGG